MPDRTNFKGDRYEHRERTQGPRTYPFIVTDGTVRSLIRPIQEWTGTAWVDTGDYLKGSDAAPKTSHSKWMRQLSLPENREIKDLLYPPGRAGGRKGPRDRN